MRSTMTEGLVTKVLIVPAAVLLVLGFARSWRDRLHRGLPPDEFEQHRQQRNRLLDRIRGMDDND